MALLSQASCRPPDLPVTPCTVRPAQELSRIYRAAWRAHGLGEEAAALPSLDELVGELEAKGVGGRYGRCVM